MPALSLNGGNYRFLDAVSIIVWASRFSAMEIFLPKRISTEYTDKR